MANLRIGKYGGHYYGSFFNESVALTNEEMKLNARYLYEVLHYIHGWSMEAVSGLLGNAQHESSLNPGRWQSNKVGVGPAYGLVQWDPYSKYTGWCASNGYSDPSEMDSNIARIIYEVDNNQQYYKTPNYPETFREFTQSTSDPYYLACAFAWNYERSYVVLYGSEAEQEALRQKRGGSAEYWYNYLCDYYSNITPDPDNPEPEPQPTPTKKKQLSLMMMYMATR